MSATTGIAATNIQAGTLYHVLGIGVRFEKKVERTHDRWHDLARTKIFIVDEVSMLENKLFNCLEEMCRYYSYE